MTISKEERDFLIKELINELHGKLDGSRKNIVCPVCPYCGHKGGKFGIYVGVETDRKKLFMSHCFSCGHTTTELNDLLNDINRPDLMLEETASFAPVEIPKFYSLNEEEIDDELCKVDMPEGWKRCYRNPYLKSRGFTFDDYDFFPVGTTRGLNWKYDDYVIFPIMDNNDIVGYIGRHTWSKDTIDEYNKKAKRNNKFQILRYNNSTENDFSKLLYNYDAVVDDVTKTVILVEGVFDVIALTRKLDLYESPWVTPVATFGKKISDTQIYKLQSKGVDTVIIGYDGDAVKSINAAAEKLEDYFDVYIAQIDDPTADFDSMDFWDIYDVFSTNIKTPLEYKLNCVQL
jgi:DNA primase